MNFVWDSENIDFQFFLNRTILSSRAKYELLIITQTLFNIPFKSPIPSPFESLNDLG